VSRGIAEVDLEADDARQVRERITGDALLGTCGRAPDDVGRTIMIQHVPFEFCNADRVEPFIAASDGDQPFVGVWYRLPSAVERFAHPERAGVGELRIIDLTANPLLEVVARLFIAGVVLEQVVEPWELSRSRPMDVNFDPVHHGAIFRDGLQYGVADIHPCQREETKIAVAARNGHAHDTRCIRLHVSGSPFDSTPRRKPTFVVPRNGTCIN